MLKHAGLNSKRKQHLLNPPAIFLSFYLKKIEIEKWKTVLQRGPAEIGLVKGDNFQYQVSRRVSSNAFSPLKRALIESAGDVNDTAAGI